MKFEDLQPSPTQASLVHIAETLALFSKQVIEENRQLAPMAHLICKRPPKWLVEQPYTTPLGFEPETELIHLAVQVAPLFTEMMDDSKDTVLRMLLYASHAVAYAVATEGWALMQNDAKTALNPDGTVNRPIRHDDRRVSVLSITGETKARDVLFGIWRIEEGEQRRVDVEGDALSLEVSNRDAPDGKEAGGRMFGLLDGL